MKVNDIYSSASNEVRIVSPEETEIQKHSWGTLNVLSEQCVSPMSFMLSAAYIYPGMSQPKHKHSNEEELLYILSGTAEYYICGTSYKVFPQNLIYLPVGMAHYGRNTGWEPLRYLSMRAPLKTDEPVSDCSNSYQEDTLIIRGDKVPSCEFEWGCHKTLNDENDPPFNMRVTVSYVLPRRQQNMFCHVHETELIYIISGQGKYMINEKEYSVQEGALLYIPAGEGHYAVNTGWEPFKIITVKTSIIN